MKTIIAVKAFITRPDKKILILRESVSYGGSKCPGYFDVVGGRVESGETMADGLKREIKEEAGLCVNVGEVIHVTDNFISIQGEKAQIVRIYYQCTTVDDVEVILSDDHDYYEWIYPEEAISINLHDDLKEIFKKLVN